MSAWRKRQKQKEAESLLCNYVTVFHEDQYSTIRPIYCPLEKRILKGLDFVCSGHWYIPTSVVNFKVRDLLKCLSTLNVPNSSLKTGVVCLIYVFKNAFHIVLETSMRLPGF